MHVNQHLNKVSKPRNDIPGWGADIDRASRPAGMSKESMPPTETGAHWTVPEHQHHRVKVFQSIERPGCTHVFGTSAPPRGLSGLIRGLAYTLGEGIKTRWMLLLLADRVDVVEGIVDDVFHGKIPNPVAEMGLKAEWKHNRGPFLGKLALGAVVVGGTAFLMIHRKKARDAKLFRRGEGLGEVIRVTTPKPAPSMAATIGRNPRVATVDARKTTVFTPKETPVVTHAGERDGMLPH